VGYWSNFSVRGYALDQHNNFRRDGLPINAETSLWLGNKQGIDVLRGTSGKPGSARPVAWSTWWSSDPTARTAARCWASSRWHLHAALDLGDSAGRTATSAGASAEATHLDPPLNSARGIARASRRRANAHRCRQAARGSRGFNHQSQPSQPGFSMLGPRVPTRATSTRASA
jgi:iron complex outermembrane receptor protein